MATLPVIASPLHDPQGYVLAHLEKIIPDLKSIFSQVFLGISAATRAAQTEHVVALSADPFFRLTNLPTHGGTGMQFRSIYAETSTACPPEQIVHLCFLDRVAYALHSEYRQAFIEDICAIQEESLPLIFHRSELAWQTHPRNYRELETIVTRTGEYLFGKTIDFAWCHLVLRADALAQAVPHLRQVDISMVAELALTVMDQARVKDVDWLAWEDPFKFGRDAQELKAEVESNPAETRKRLAYVIPMLRILDVEAARRGMTA